MNIFKIISFRVNSTLFFTISICCMITQIAVAASDCSLSTVDRNLFADSIFQKLAAGKEENVIFSPASIQTALALLFFGAGGETAQELRNVLKLGNADSEIIAKNFENFVGDSFKSSNEDNGIQFRMANRVYVAQDAQLKSNFNEIATRAFQSQAEKVNFTDSDNTVKKINQFVEEQTQHKIKDLLPEDSVDSLTRVVLINAIYFKGKWKFPFSASSTQKSNFFYERNRKVQVDTMITTKKFRYGEFSDLDAQVLELPYLNSNLSMLFLLPNRVDGLSDLEKKLEGKNLNEIASNLTIRDVKIYIPKFRIEYEIVLKKPLQELGLKTVFQDGQADLSALLENPNREYVSDVRHKAYIDVNEAGSEAAAVTFVQIVLRRGSLYFIANHPFVFAIRDSEAVYFMGHVHVSDERSQNYITNSPITFHHR